MRNFKRFLAMALTMLMLASSLSILSSAKFEDVTNFQKEIAVLEKLGVIKGNADGTFGFDKPVTRRQTALFFARALTGKVDDKVHWQSTVNTTPFKDLDAENDYYGAISFNQNNGIVKGRSATEFAPNDNIKFKEAITMAVRALGYKGADLDAGYPWTYYNKAVTLGLDKGLDEIGLEEVVTRGTMAKLIYNMMFAVNADGSTLAAKAFGSAVKTSTFVLAATKGKTLVANLANNANDKIAAFVEINSDGTLNYDKVYHFAWADFAALAYGADNTEKAYDHVGHSFSVVTLDNYKSLVLVDENPDKAFTSADYVGDGKLDGGDYALVQKWSSVFNIGTTISGKDELIQYNTLFAEPGATPIGKGLVYYDGNYYVVDEYKNILSTTNTILLYYYEYIVNTLKEGDKIVEYSNTTFPYYTKIGNLYFAAILPVGSRYQGAATVDQHYAATAPVTYHSNMNAPEYTSKVSAYADTVAFDDNGDGVYDRAYFTAYNFGKYTSTKNDDGSITHTVTLGAKGSVTKAVKDSALIDLTGAAKSGDYVLWAYDAINGTITIKKVYSTIKQGYVTGVDLLNKTITFGNISYLGLNVGTAETVKYGVDKLPGATDTNGIGYILANGNDQYKVANLIGVSYTLLHKYVSYVVDEEKDNRVVAIIDEQTQGSELVITSFDATSYMTFGNIRAYAIDSDGNSQFITISNINGVPAINYTLLQNFYELVDAWGGLVYGAKQTDGTWVIWTSVKEDNLYQVNVGNDDVAGTTLSFYKGIAFENIEDRDADNYAKKYIVDYKTRNRNLEFAASNDDKLVIIIYDVDDNRYTIAKGIPQDGAQLFIRDGTIFYARPGYMYIWRGLDDDNLYYGRFKTRSKWNLSYAYESGIANDVIYIKNDPAYAVAAGYTYQLSAGDYFSVINGETPSSVITYVASPITLQKGHYYKVTKTLNGNNTVLTVYEEVDPQTSFARVDVKEHASFYIKDLDGIYRFYGDKVILLDWTDPSKAAADKKVTAQPKSGFYYETYYYSGRDISSNVRVLLVVAENAIPVPPAPVAPYELTSEDPEFGDSLGGTPITNRIRIDNVKVEERDGDEVIDGDEIGNAIASGKLTVKAYAAAVGSDDEPFEIFFTTVYGPVGGTTYALRLYNFEVEKVNQFGDKYREALSGDYFIQVVLTYTDGANYSDPYAAKSVLVTLP